MLLVIDGSAIVSTCYFGTLPSKLKNYSLSEDEREKLFYLISHSSKGDFTNAIQSSLSFILNIINNNDKELDKMVVCFDRTRNTFRKKLYSEYKANRKSKEAPLKNQIKAFEEVLDYIGITTLSSDEFEADDLAGSVITQTKGDEPVYFLTKDHDWFQLLDDQSNVKGVLIENTADIAMKQRMKYGNIPENDICVSGPLHLLDKMYCVDSAVCMDKEGVLPKQIPDKKGLSGDKSDNIPGIKGVGDSATLPLLKAYGSVDGIYDEIHKYTNPADLQPLWKTNFSIGPAKFKKIVEAEKDAKLSRKLATIKNDCEIPKTNFKMNLNNEKLNKVLSYYEISL